MNQTAFERILQNRIIAIIRGVPSTQMEQTIQALLDGGVECAEITYRPASVEESRDTLRSIARVRERFGDRVLVGAGTVLSAQQAADAAEAGAQYIISPNVSRAVIEKTRELGLISMPGAFTPTEAQQAVEYGAQVVKMFPAGLLGPEYIKAVLSSMSHLLLAAVGGVDVQNIAAFSAAGTRLFGIGGSLVSAKVAAEGRFDIITENARQLTAALRDNG